MENLDNDIQLEKENYEGEYPVTLDTGADEAETVIGHCFEEDGQFFCKVERPTEDEKVHALKQIGERRYDQASDSFEVALECSKCLFTGTVKVKSKQQMM